MRETHWFLHTWLMITAAVETSSCAKYHQWTTDSLKYRSIVRPQTEPIQSSSPAGVKTKAARWKTPKYSCRDGRLSDKSASGHFKAVVPKPCQKRHKHCRESRHPKQRALMLHIWNQFFFVALRANTGSYYFRAAKKTKTAFSSKHLWNVQTQQI